MTTTADLSRRSDTELEEGYADLRQYLADLPGQSLFRPVRDMLSAEAREVLLSIAREIDRRDVRAGMPGGSTRWQLEQDA